MIRHLVSWTSLQVNHYRPETRCIHRTTCTTLPSLHPLAVSNPVNPSCNSFISNVASTSTSRASIISANPTLLLIDVQPRTTHPKQNSFQLRPSTKRIEYSAKAFVKPALSPSRSQTSRQKKHQHNSSTLPRWENNCEAIGGMISEHISTQEAIV